MNGKYIYPALFEPCEEGGYTVTFPDLKGCITEGDTLEEALHMAKEALELYLYNLEDDGDSIPISSLPNNIRLEDKNSFISLVEAWMIPIREKMKNKAVKKNCTIPKWLNDVAEKDNANFSLILQTALKDRYGIAEKR